MWGRRPKTVAEIDSFIELLSVACEDSSVHATLDKILTLPDNRREAVIQSLLADMRQAGAPKDFMAAIACLADTAVAEKAYEVIFNCRR